MHLHCSKLSDDTFKHLRWQCYEERQGNASNKILDYDYLRGLGRRSIKGAHGIHSALCLKLAIGSGGAHFVSFVIMSLLLVFKYTSKFEELLKENKHPQPQSERINNYPPRLGKKGVEVFTLTVTQNLQLFTPKRTCTNFVMEQKRRSCKGSSFMTEEGGVPVS